MRKFDNVTLAKEQFLTTASLAAVNSFIIAGDEIFAIACTI